VGATSLQQARRGNALAETVGSEDRWRPLIVDVEPLARRP
jgi:hypothetical protein